MQVVAGDVLEHIGRTGVDRHVVADAVAEGLRPLAIDQDRLEFIPGRQCSLDHQVALGDEPAGHLTARKLPFLA